MALKEQPPLHIWKGGYSFYIDLLDRPYIYYRLSVDPAEFVF